MSTTTQTAEGKIAKDAAKGVFEGDGPKDLYEVNIADVFGWKCEAITQESIEYRFTDEEIKIAKEKALKLSTSPDYNFKEFMKKGMAVEIELCKLITSASSGKETLSPEEELELCKKVKAVIEEHNFIPDFALQMPEEGAPSSFQLAFTTRNNLLLQTFIELGAELPKDIQTFIQEKPKDRVAISILKALEKRNAFLKSLEAETKQVAESVRKAIDKEEKERESKITLELQSLKVWLQSTIKELATDRIAPLKPKTTAELAKSGKKLDHSFQLGNPLGHQQALRWHAYLRDVLESFHNNLQQFLKELEGIIESWPKQRDCEIHYCAYVLFMKDACDTQLQALEQGITPLPLAVQTLCNPYLLYFKDSYRSFAKKLEKLLQISSLTSTLKNIETFIPKDLYSLFLEPTARRESNERILAANKRLEQSIKEAIAKKETQISGCICNAYPVQYQTRVYTTVMNCFRSCSNREIAIAEALKNNYLKTEKPDTAEFFLFLCFFENQIDSALKSNLQAISLDKQLFVKVPHLSYSSGIARIEEHLAAATSRMVSLPTKTNRDSKQISEQQREEALQALRESARLEVERIKAIERERKERQDKERAEALQKEAERKEFCEKIKSLNSTQRIILYKILKCDPHQTISDAEIRGLTEGLKIPESRETASGFKAGNTSYHTPHAGAGGVDGRAIHKFKASLEKMMELPNIVQFLEVNKLVKSAVIRKSSSRA